MNMYEELDIQALAFSTVIVGGECSASSPGRFTPEERVTGTHWIGGWLGPRAGLDETEK
jgi:hypothetical protein